MREALITLLILMTIAASAQTRKETYNGQIITESSHMSKFSSRKVYIYEINKLTQVVDSIKKSKMSFSDITKYPVWDNPEETKKMFIAFDTHVQNSFIDNGMAPATEDYLLSCHYLLNDNGEVICNTIRTKKSLFDFYSPSEIIDIFDNINNFRFPTPIVRYPKDGKGYEELSSYF